MVLELHAALLRQGRGERRNPGQFRTIQVFLGTSGGQLKDARYVPPPWEQVRPLMDSLLAFATGQPTYGHLIDAALMHYQFEAVHPFEDGNGRLGRALIPLFLMSRAVMDKPILYLGAFFAAHRDTYIELLGRVSKRGDWVEWVEFFLDGVLSEARDADLRLRRVDSLATRYRNAAGSASRSAIPLLALDHVIDRVFVSIGDIARLTATTVPTARNAITVLEGLGILKLGPRIRGKQFWVAQEVIDELYQI
jgi:Fic family protein